MFVERMPSPHSLEAVREGHVFHKSADGLNFSHQKLSSLTVRVVDAVPPAGAAHA